jgi:hydroxymethylbilane synthase
MLRALNDAPTAACVAAERAMSLALSGSCQLPLGAFAESGAGSIRLRGFVATRDGTRIVRDELTGSADDPEALGSALAAKLRKLGAMQILAEIENG